MAGQLDQAVALHASGRLAEAEEIYRQLLASDPRNVVLLLNWGHVLNGLQQFNPALDAYDRALAQDSRHAILHLARGDVLQCLLRYGEAVESYDRFLRHVPDHADAWNSRGLALQNLGRLEEALESYRRAEALDPQFAAARLNRGHCHLLMQDFAQGLPLYEWRKRMPQPMEARSYPQPLWTGAEETGGRILFAYVEQGLGDTIHFYRYVSFALARGAEVVLSVPDRLVTLLKNATPTVQLIGRDEVPAKFDFHIPLASIPLAVGMRADAIPAPQRYLTAEPDRAARWKARLGEQGFRIGIAWQGKEQIRGLEGKSFPVAALANIARMPDIRLISVQKGEGVEQLDQLPAGMAVETYDFDEGPNAFLDSAAIMQACDLVITADTAPAHLAGALGVPAWLALKHVPDWRWFMGRMDSPWYPSVRLFRQPRTGEWDSVFQAMAAELISRRS
jgi:tetratricopeptide (TPR) repeat protein